MKLAIGIEAENDWHMTLIPETPEEQQALHDIRFRGIRSIALLGVGRAPRQDLQLKLGAPHEG